MREKLSVENIKKYINEPLPIHLYDSVTSTNTVAAGMVRDNQQPLHGTSVFALHQTGGKGRLGRSFASPDSCGIYMSVILEPDAEGIMLITTAAAVAVCKALEKVCGQQPQIKWVNDIYLNNKKICGILAEAVTDHRTGTISHVVLGIGINLQSDALPDELSEIAGAVEGDFSVNHLAAEVLNQVIELSGNLTDPEIIAAYRERSLVIGKKIKVYKGGYSPETVGIPAYVLDIDENGGLVVIYSNGEQDTLSTGEISIRL